MLDREGKSGVESVILRWKNTIRSGVFEHTISIGKEKLSLSMNPIIGEKTQFNVPIDSVPARRLIRSDRIVLEMSDEDHWKMDKSLWMMEGISSSFSPYLIGPLSWPAFYFPADRTGVMHARSIVVSALINRASMAGLRPPTMTPMLSGVLANFLEQLVALSRLKSNSRTRFRDLNQWIEERLLEGSVSVKSPDELSYPQFVYRPHG